MDVQSNDGALTYSVSLLFYSPEVEFCGYSIPHPSEAKIHLRIQMYGECLCPCSHIGDDTNQGINGGTVE